MVLHLISSFDIKTGQVQTQLDVDDIYLNINTAIPCGLLINELVSNSLKYAFPNNRKGKIYISMTSGNDSSILLRVGDDGIGLPPELDFRNTKTLGLQLANDLVKQLKGDIHTEKGEGTVFNIRFQA
jgi:two-component sensor histidine kinase